MTASMDDVRGLTCSVVVCSDGRARSLAGVLRSLEHLEGPPFEVVVVRGPTEDGIGAVLGRWQGRIKVVANPLRKLSVSRNLGIAASRGEVVAFVDDDGFPEAEWLEELLPAFADPRVAAAGGIVMDHTGLREQSRFSSCDRLGHPDGGHAAACDDLCVPGSFDIPYVQGTNAAFRRTALEAIGGFDEEYEFYLDEVDVCCRLVDAGWRIRQLAAAVVHHQMLPSDIRDEARRINRLLPVLKNKLYFSLVNNVAGLPIEEILADFESRVEFLRGALAHRHQAGEITAAVVEQFEDDVLQARRVGWERGMEASRRLMPPGLAARIRTPFLPFQPPRLRSSRPRFVHALAAPDGEADTLPRQARAQASRGHHVHVVAAGAGPAAVWYDGRSGVWRHRVAADGVDSAGRVTDILREVERITERQRVDAVSVWRQRPAARRRKPVPSGGTKTVDERPAAAPRHLPLIMAALAPLLAGVERVALVGFPHQWNIGDSVIWAGTLHVLRALQANVSYVCTHRSYDPGDLRRHLPEGPILLCGGGNFGDVYENEAGLRRRVLADFPDRPVIQLPQSVWFKSARGRDALRRIVDAHRGVTLLLRERQSLETAEGWFQAPTLLCPDMALALEGLLPVAGAATAEAVWLLRRDAETLPCNLPPLAAAIDWPMEDAAWRRTWPRAGQQAWTQVTAWHEAGAGGGGVPMHLAIDATAALAEARTLAGARLVCAGGTVFTDRLHAAILARLSGRPTVLMDNVYGKNRAVAEAWFHADDGLRLVANRRIAASVSAGRMSIRLRRAA